MPAKLAFDDDRHQSSVIVTIATKRVDSSAHGESHRCENKERREPRIDDRSSALQHGPFMNSTMRAGRGFAA
jgi:hypothetical protein